MDQQDQVELGRRLQRLEAQVALLSEKAGVPFGEPATDVPAEVVELARSGDASAAIVRYRDLTGVSLAEAKDVVDRL